LTDGAGNIFDDEKQYLIFLLSKQIIHFPYSPDAIVKKNLISLFDFLQEIAEQNKEEKRKGNTIFIRHMKRWKGVCIKVEDVAALKYRMFEYLLTLTGNGLLRGFGFANKFGDALVGNAEYVPLDGTRLRKTFIKEDYKMSKAFNPEKDVKREVDFKELKELVKKLNKECCLKIKTVAVKKTSLLSDFVFAIEKLDEERKDFSDEFSDYYNSLFTAETEKPAKAAKEKPAKAAKEKPAKAAKGKPAKAAKAAKGKSAKASKEVIKDAYGFTVGSKASMFCLAIKKKAMTMAEVRELPWNENKAAYSGTFAKLKRDGFGVKKEDGKMTIVKA